MYLLLSQLYSTARESDYDVFKQCWEKLMLAYLADEIDLVKIVNTAHLYSGKAFPPLLVSAIQGGSLEIVKHIALDGLFDLDVKAHYLTKLQYSITHFSSLNRFAIENFLLLPENKTEPKLTFSLEEKLTGTATPTISCYFMPLSLAIYNKSIEITCYLLNSGGPVWDEKQDFLYSPFYEAIMQAYYSQDLRFIELLIEKLRLANEEKRFLDYFSRKGVDVLINEKPCLARWACCYFIEKSPQVNNDFSSCPTVRLVFQKIDFAQKELDKALIKRESNFFAAANKGFKAAFFTMCSKSDFSGKEDGFGYMKKGEAPVVSIQPRSTSGLGC
jgi:hypothetical protein